MIERAPEYKKIGDRLLKNMECFSDIREFGVRIAFLKSDEQKKKNHKIVMADCTRVNDRYSWCCHYDFMITVYEPNCVDLNYEQMEILMEHELRHCGINLHGVEPSWYVVPHDVEEFQEIIDKYGIEWAERTNHAKRRESKQQKKPNSESRFEHESNTKDSIESWEGFRRGKKSIHHINTDIEGEMHS